MNQNCKSGTFQKNTNLFYTDKKATENLRKKNYKITGLYFATHGLLPGELCQSEPGLVLTPPLSQQVEKMMVYWKQVVLHLELLLI